MKEATIFFFKIIIKQMENLQDRGSGSGSGLNKLMDPNPVCPDWLEPDPDPVNIRLDPTP